MNWWLNNQSSHDDINVEEKKAPPREGVQNSKVQRSEKDVVFLFEIYVKTIDLLGQNLLRYLWYTTLIYV